MRDRTTPPYIGAALRLEVEYKESCKQSRQSPSLPRINACFKTLDTLILNDALSPYSELLAAVRDELFRSVFSEDFTAAAEDPSVERVPYFVEVNRAAILKYRAVHIRGAQGRAGARMSEASGRARWNWREG